MSNLSFTKLFSSITDSSVWQESSDVRVVWVTLMAMSDPLGRVHAAIPGLARRANVSREATEKALAVFLSPDPDSRSKDHDGRRIEEISGGWRLLNYATYREMRDEEARKEKNRIYQERFRSKTESKESKILSDKNLTVRNVRNSKTMSAQEEVEVEGEEESTNTTTSTLASTALAVPAARGLLRGTLPLTGKRVYEVRDDDFARDGPLYPGIDLGQEYRAMKAWLLANPTHQKTPNGIRRFMNRWLSNAQDKAKPGGGNGNRTYSKTGGNLTAAAGALAILEQAERNSNLADEMQPEAGGGGESGDLGHLRTGSIEL